MTAFVKWESVRKQILETDSELVEIIDNWKPDFKLIKTNYRFGDKILKDGTLYLGINNAPSLPITSPKIQQDIRSNLEYSNVPLGFITSGCSEVYLETEQRVIPLSFFTPGIILGLWESLTTNNDYFPKRVWDVTAGARTIFMLPNIGQKMPHERLKKKFNIRNSAPTNIYNHHATFEQIVNSPAFKTNWTSEIIFFGKDWLKRDSKNPHWLRFHHYLLEKAWELSAYNRNKITLDKIWLSFNKQADKRGIKVSPQVLHVLKQIVSIGIGAAPGFRPLSSSSLHLPVKELQKIYLQTYGLKKYIPTIMAVDYFHPYKNNQPIYYSLQAQTQIEPVNKIKNILSELREIQSVVELFIEIGLLDALKIEDTLIDWLIKNVSVEFFHPDAKSNDTLENSKKLPIKDKALVHIPGARRGRQFSASAAFTTGCIRLSLLEKPRA
jgi:hypothetical protein